MTTEHDLRHQPPKQDFSHCLELLARVSRMEDNWLKNENEGAIQQLLTKGLPLLDRVTEHFQEANETNMAIWTILQKASLMGDLAKFIEPSSREDLARQALQQVKNGFAALADNPPSTYSMTTTLYLMVIESVFKIRDLFSDPSQIDALEELIQGLSAHFGEFLALDLTLRGQAYDQLFIAQVLETLVDLQKDPQTQQEMIASSKDLALQAYDKLQHSADADLTQVTAFLHTLEQKKPQETQTTKIFCPQCGAGSATGTRFCGQCNTRLIQEAK